MSPMLRSRAVLASVLVLSSLVTACSGSGNSILTPRSTGSATATPAASAKPTATATAKATATATASASSDGQTAFTTTTRTGTVVLPAGTTIGLGSLTAVNSLGRSAIGSSGAFSLLAFADGAQLTTIVDANGSPVLLGWLGSSSSTIDVNSTADVLAFFGTASFTLTSDLRKRVKTLIPTAPGIGTLASTIGSAIVANPSAFATTNANVSNALQTFVSSLIAPGNAANTTQGSLHAIFARHRDGVLINGTTPSSGLTPLIDFPSGFHFMNADRRPADVYVTRVSHVDGGGTTVTDNTPVNTLPIAVPGTSGVQGGTVSTLVDIVNGTYAYSPVTTEPVPLPNVSGAQSTLYQLVAVGPDANPGIFSSLPASQQTDGNTLGIEFLATDFVIPLVLAQILPDEDFDGALKTPGIGDAIADLVAALATVPAIAQASANGDMGSAIAQSFDAIAQSNSVINGALAAVVMDILESKGTAAETAASETSEGFLKVLTIADRIDSAFDASIVFAQLTAANRADSWNVTVTPDKVTLTPASSTLAAGLDETLTAAVPDASGSSAAFAYTWTNTARFGHLFDGQAGHEDNFMSSNAIVTFVANATGPQGTDTVGVSVAYIDESKRDAVNAANATVTVVPSPSPTPTNLSIAISPAGCENFGTGGGSQNYTATATGVPMGQRIAYGWAFGTNGGRPPSKITFTDTGSTYSSSSAEFVGPSNTVNVSVASDPAGGEANLSLQVQLFYVDAMGNENGPSTFVAAQTYLSFGTLMCANANQ